jgi:hypothetical protein
VAKRDFAVTTCPICLDVDEAESMVAVPIQRTNPPDTRIVLFCRRCVRSIFLAAAELEAAPSTEGENDAATRARDPGGTDSALATASASSPLVLQTESHHENSGLDRPEPKSATGGEGAAVADESADKASRVGQSTVVEK